jgi:hypothetical protein
LSVFVLDRRRKPLMPCSEKLPRLLLERGRARVARRYPFTIRLIDRAVEECSVQPVRIKIDPGSKTTGFRRLCRLAPVCGIAMELVRFDMQKMDSPERAVIRSGKTAGSYVGRVAIRASKTFKIQTAEGVVQGIHGKHFELLARGDGYGCALTRELLSAPGLKRTVARTPI